MNILLVNDDGIRAAGIKALADTLSAVAHIYVSAPATQMSATGHSITFHEPIHVQEVDFENACLAMEVAGTPADCVKIAVEIMRERGVEPDMVFSGINHGSNLGTDTLYSGTVAGAIEGSICGYPAVAVSVDSFDVEHFEVAAELALATAKKAYGKLNCKRVLNINVPDLPRGDIKGVRYTRLGVREYDKWFETVEVIQGTRDYSYTGAPVIYEDSDLDVDVIAVQEDYASITPLQYDFTDFEMIDEIKKWGITDETAQK